MMFSIFCVMSWQLLEMTKKIGVALWNLRWKKTVVRPLFYETPFIFGDVGESHQVTPFIFCQLLWCSLTRGCAVKWLERNNNTSVDSYKCYVYLRWGGCFLFCLLFLFIFCRGKYSPMDFASSILLHIASLLIIYAFFFFFFSFLSLPQV